MNFLIFWDFSKFFSNFYEFILDLFKFFYIKIIFIRGADIAADVAGR